MRTRPATRLASIRPLRSLHCSCAPHPTRLWRCSRARTSHAAAAAKATDPSRPALLPAAPGALGPSNNGRGVAVGASAACLRHGVAADRSSAPRLTHLPWTVAPRTAPLGLRGSWHDTPRQQQQAAQCTPHSATPLVAGCGPPKGPSRSAMSRTRPHGAAQSSSC